MTLIIDPPSGWLYGFPKPFDFKPSHPSLPGEEYEKELRQWFIDKGYPRENLDLALKYSRFWEE